ncbi:hypothetical protein TNCV_4984071 [Trichonephila clavipes]|nr:hypothetical protein TNCV_4984071 [Trichonephila clavipes]
MKIDRDDRRTYRKCDNCPETELTPVHIFDCSIILAALHEIRVLVSSINPNEDNIEKMARTAIWAHSIG